MLASYSKQLPRWAGMDLSPFLMPEVRLPVPPPTTMETPVMPTCCRSSYRNYPSYGKNWYSDGDQRNKLVALFLSPTFYGFSISSSFVASQSARYSAYINKDIIGEGNDGTNLAYIYDPNDPKPPPTSRQACRPCCKQPALVPQIPDGQFRQIRSVQWRHHALAHTVEPQRSL